MNILAPLILAAAVSPAATTAAQHLCKNQGGWVAIEWLRGVRWFRIECKSGAVFRVAPKTVKLITKQRG